MMLVPGATRLLASEVVTLLRSSGKRVRALAPATSDSARVEVLRQTGADIVIGNLKKPNFGSAIRELFAPCGACCA